MPKMFRQPVIVLGTPRSGTSLVHRILRSLPGFVSPTREAHPAWRPHTHPAHRQWRDEGWGLGEPSEGQAAAIRRRIELTCLPAESWRQIDDRALSEKRHAAWIPAAMADPVFDCLVRARNMTRGSPRDRLVMKSVHASLWLDLVDAIFPDAIYVHVTRDPVTNLQSMINAWLDPKRFFTYRLPVQLQISAYPYERWNFGLPTGWHDWIEQPLEDVVAFQWAAMQRGMLNFADGKRGRWHTLRLEGLVADTRSELEAVCDWLGIHWNPHIEQFARSLPRVNAGGPARTGGPSHAAIEAALAPYAAVIEKLGYRH